MKKKPRPETPDKPPTDEEIAARFEAIVGVGISLNYNKMGLASNCEHHRRLAVLGGLQALAFLWASIYNADQTLKCSELPPADVAWCYDRMAKVLEDFASVRKPGSQN